MQQNMMQQNMANMMNMINMNNGGKFLIFDPIKADKKIKNSLTGQTIYQTKIGMYNKFPKGKHSSFSFFSTFQIPVAMDICKVKVINEHVLDVVEPYTEHGLNCYAPNNINNMNPCIVNVVGKEFTGANLEINEEIRDELINIRTTFNGSFETETPFPLKEDESTYLKIITVIRPKYPNGYLPYPQTYRTAVITASPITTEKLNEDKMFATDFVKTCTAIECIFQHAIYRGHPVLILPPFGHEDNNPVDDIIMIYNYCIMRYGHCFKEIIIAIPPYYPKEIFAKYYKGIMKPNELVVEIDKKYEKELIKQQLTKGTGNVKTIPTVSNKKNNLNKEQIDMLMNMISMMNNK